MNIAIFGATGKTGLQLTEQALARGHSVTALVRSPEKLTIDHPNLTVSQGDVLNQDDVATTIQGADGVICALGTSSIGKTTVRSQGTANIVKALQTAGVNRLIVISAMGLGKSYDQIGWGARLILYTLLRNVMADHHTQEDFVKNSGLNWTILRPSGLTDGPKAGPVTYGLATDSSISGGRISRADLAAFALDQLDADQYIHQAVSVT